MRTFFTLILLSIVGIGIAFGVSFYADMEQSGDNTPLPLMQLPYKNFIAATGMVEATSKNIFVGSMTSGIIKKVYVQSGDSVKKGALLFEIDDAQKRVRIPVLKAEIASSLAKLKSTKHQVELLENMKKLSSNMVTNEKYTKIMDDYNEAKTFYQLSKAKLKALKSELAFYKVYAPIDGKVLQSNITVGSSFDANTKALILGSDKLNVKVNINEFDSAKLDTTTKAVAFIRDSERTIVTPTSVGTRPVKTGVTEKKIELKYKYTIPFIVPKKNLTGSSTEQTDTRVLQVVYAVQKRANFPLYVGEMLDVFIETSGDK